MKNTKAVQYEYEIQGFYPGSGWEMETCEDTRVDALAQLKAYRENMPEYAHRLKRVRAEVIA